MTAVHTHDSLSTIGARLADHVASLAEITQSAGDLTSTTTLRHLEPRLRQGLVRIAVVGITGSGKSTLINALVDQLILPENPSVSSPIPVWIGYHEKDAITADIYEKKGDTIAMTTCSIEDFRRKYCYNIDDILDCDRTRFNHVSFGAASTNSPLLQGNVTLIDTLGIAATTVDSQKTIRVLEEGVDAVIFVTKNNVLTKAEERFLYRYILGCRSKENPDPQACNPHPILPAHLLFVHNNFSGVPSPVAFAERVKTLYRDSDLHLSEEEIQRCASENICFVNALQARLGSLGVYPYSTNAPEGTSPEDLLGLKEKEAGEQWKLDHSDTEQLVKDSQIRQLTHKIRALSNRLAYGPQSVSVQRIQELVPVIDGISLAAHQRIAAMHLTTSELQTKQSLLKEMQQDDLATHMGIHAAMKQHRRDYLKGFEQLLPAVTTTLTDPCQELAAATPTPEDLAGWYDAFRHMNKSQKEAHLHSLLEDQVKTTYSYCTSKILEALDQYKTGNVTTPLVVLENTKEYLMVQAQVLSDRINGLKKAGFDQWGMFFPQPPTVEKMYEKLAQDLEEEVTQVIKEAGISGGQHFKQETLPKLIRRCDLSILQRFVGIALPNRAGKQLWDRLRKYLFVPMANTIVALLPEYILQRIEQPTTDAFDAIAQEVCLTHTQLFVSLEMTHSKIQNQIQQANADAVAYAADMQTLIDTCDTIKNDILIMQAQLQLPPQ